MEGLTNSTKKQYASLSTPKGRRELNMFMAQGTKCVLDTIDYFEAVAVIATEAWFATHPNIPLLYPTALGKPADLQRISTLTTAPDVIAIYRIPETPRPDIRGKLALALDGIQDPGNLGTIMRVADWMGVRNIIASVDTVDVWNPKVVQATMGAISRVEVYYTDLKEYLRQSKMPIYGTTLDGDNIYTAGLSNEGIIIMGNEGKGIRPEIAKELTRRLYIPPYPQESVTSESLNVAIATAITLAEFRRRCY